MRRVAAIAVFCATVAVQGEPLDRIAVSIGSQVITESALILDLRVSAFLDHGPVDLSPDAKRRSADRLTDQILIVRDAQESHFELPAAQKAASLLEQVKQDYGSPAQYQAALRQYGIEESDVADRLLAGLVGISFTDLRFQPGIQISEEDLRAYYDKLETPASFEDSQEDIRAILTRQRVSDALDQWLVQTRVAARVQFREQVFE